MPEISLYLRAEEICSKETLEAMKAEWADLWERCPDAVPFQHPAWIIPWWRHFRGDKQLLSLAFRDRGTLVGMAPFFILQERGWRKLMPIGIGLSDYIDALFAPGFEEPGSRAIFDLLAQVASLWDICDLQPLLADATLLTVPIPESLTSIVEPVDTLTALDLPAERGQFRQRLSRRFSNRVREAGLRAAKLGSVQFETATRATFGGLFDHLLRFHEARWRKHSQASANPSSPAGLFHREAASAMLRRNELRLSCLKISGQVVAVLYAFVHQRRGFFYMLGFNPEFGQISPGMLLMIHAIEGLIEEGVTECEFPRGREAFKYRWGVFERTTYARKLHSKR